MNWTAQTNNDLNELNTCHTLNQHPEVRWRAVARRSSQLKPYPLGGAHPLSRWSGTFFNLSGRPGRDPVAAALVGI